MSTPPPGPVLITGADGFVGRHVRAALAARWPTLAVSALPGDIADADAVAEAVRAAAPAACLHLAGIAAPAQAAADPALAWRVNLHGTLTLAASLARHAPGCQLVFAGSAEAYGASFAGGAPLDESAPLAPLTVYGATKAAADLALGALAGDALPVVRLRPFNHVGPGQSADFALASFARQLALIGAGRQPPVLRVGRLDGARDFLDVRDVADAYVACLASRATLPVRAIVNVASGVPRRIGGILEAMIALSGLTVRIETDLARVRPQEIASASGSAARAAAWLGWQPRIAWPQTLADILADWRARLA